MGLINPDLSGIVDGQIGDAADWNNPFNTLISEFNGNIDTTNIDAAAGILFTQLENTAWTSWSPTWTNLSVGNGTVTATYAKIGRFVVFDLTLTFGSTTAISGAVTVSLPVTAASPGTANVNDLGTANLADASAAQYQGTLKYASTTTANINFNKTVTVGANTLLSTDNALSSTAPFTWTTSDLITLHGFYQSAA